MCHNGQYQYHYYSSSNTSIQHNWSVMSKYQRSNIACNVYEQRYRNLEPGNS